MQIRIYILIFFISCSFFGNTQIANYVSNGGFEEVFDCFSSDTRPKNWLSFDSNKTLAYGGINLCTCSGAVPNSSFGYQEPKSGENFMITTPWCGIQNCFAEKRLNLKNRLKTKLDSGVTYCVKFYVVATNYSPYHTSAIGAHFGSAVLDTISWTGGNRPLPFIVPQIKNPLTNYITDTLNWTPITGTFVAGGMEKYMVIGNFEPSPFTYTLLADPNQAATDAAEIYLDHISCIPIDLPAYAGPDKRCIPGDSVFVGRPSDVEIDESCTWYKWPNMATPIATIAGLYVKPVTTTTYVVRQQLWCSGVRYDTVVVYEDAVGYEKLRKLKNGFVITPQPTNNSARIKSKNGNIGEEFQELVLSDELGRSIEKLEISVDMENIELKTCSLPNGIYSLVLKARKLGGDQSTKLVVIH